MTALDWFVVAGYLAGMLALAAWIGRLQRSASDYFLGGHRMPPSALAASTIATQCSTNSLLGAPAFVGFAAGGGLLWLQYELAVPLAMLALLFLLVPARQLGLTSIYSALEDNLGRRARRTASATFLLFRGVATGVTIYGVGLVIATLLDISYLAAVALFMLVVLAYDILGGLRAVVVSDVIQLALLIAAVIVALLSIGNETGWDAVFAERTDTLVNGWGVSGDTFSFWPMLLGGLFLYVAYYGADQSQAQRVLAAEDPKAAQRVLVYNGLLRFPLVLLYCLLGLALAAYAQLDSGFVDRLPLTAAGDPNINLVFPAYVLERFAPGLVGLVMVGLLAAAMSSIDSALNSLSAATVEDFLPASASDRAALLRSRLVTTAWGMACVLFSFQVEAIAPTVLEAINKVGSMANGPLLALVMIGLLTQGTRERAALIGFASGIALNVIVAWQLPQVSWLWWNVTGFATALLVCSLANGGGLKRRALKLPPTKRSATVLLLGFGLIVLVTLGLDNLQGRQ